MRRGPWRGSGTGAAKSNYLYTGVNYSVLCGGSIIYSKHALLGMKNE